MKLSNKYNINLIEGRERLNFSTPVKEFYKLFF